MSRPSQSITVNDKDIISLRKLSAGMDPNLALRAKIILESVDTPSAKEVAERLHIDQRSVALWKKRYLADGLQGLQKIHGGGPQGQPVEPLLPLLQERIEQAEPWTVASLAQQFHTTPYAVTKALKQADVELRRNHLWECRTTDSFVHKTFCVHALYLSHDAQAVVLCSQDLLPGESLQLHSQMISDTGVLQTRNRILASEIEHSTSPLGLSDVIVAAGNHCSDVLRARRVDLSAFLESVISELSVASGIEYHIYAHAATPPVYRGIAAAHIDYSSTKTVDDWKTSASACMEHLSGYAFRQEVSSLMSAIQDYLSRCLPSTEPFCWKKEGYSMKKKEITSEKAMVQESAENLLNQMEEADSGLQMGAVLLLHDKNGLSTNAVLSQESLPALEEMDFSSPEAIGRSLGKVELAIDRFVHELAVKLEQQYAEDAKKNEAQ